MLSMRDAATAVQMFQSRIKEELPEFRNMVVNVTPDGFGNFTVLDVPVPFSPSRCRLAVLYREDCFEVSFSVAEARGPAERQIIISGDLAGAVAATTEFLGAIVDGHVVVDLLRCRSLSLQPYYLAFFRDVSERPKGRVVETVRWKANGKA
jgi:hypothetical protein